MPKQTIVFEIDDGLTADQTLAAFAEAAKHQETRPIPLAAMTLQDDCCQPADDYDPVRWRQHRNKVLQRPMYETEVHFIRQRPIRMSDEAPRFPLEEEKKIEDGAPKGKKRHD